MRTKYGKEVTEWSGFLLKHLTLCKKPHSSGPVVVLLPMETMARLSLTISHQEWGIGRQCWPQMTTTTTNNNKMQYISSHLWFDWLTRENNGLWGKWTPLRAWGARWSGKEACHPSKKLLQLKNWILFHRWPGMGQGLHLQLLILMLVQSNLPLHPQSTDFQKCWGSVCAGYFQQLWLVKVGSALQKKLLTWSLRAIFICVLFKNEFVILSKAVPSHLEIYTFFSLFISWVLGGFSLIL